jgi:hypothetical protein
LKIGDGSSRISATINAPKNNYAWDAAHALVKGQPHIFGGYSDSYKVLFCLTNKNYEIGKNSITKFQNNYQDCAFGRLLFERNSGATQRRTKMAKKVKLSFYFSILLKFQALVCFGKYDDTRKSCEIFDGSSSAPTFAADWTHVYGALGLYKHQPATVGCEDAHHQKVETLSSTGWTALPDFPL